MIMFTKLEDDIVLPYYQNNNKEFEDLFPDVSIFNVDTLTECITIMIDYYVRHSNVLRGLKAIIHDSYIEFETEDGKNGIHFAYDILKKFESKMIHNGKSNPLNG